MRIKIKGRRADSNQRLKMKNRFFFGQKILDENGVTIRFFGRVKARWSVNKGQWVLTPPAKTEQLVIPANDVGISVTNQAMGA